MPNYSYHCKKCGRQYEIWHSMTEEHDKCNVCGDSSVVRIPAHLGDVYVACAEKVGDVVNGTIEEIRKEVEEYKKELSKEVDK